MHLNLNSQKKHIVNISRYIALYAISILGQVLKSCGKFQWTRQDIVSLQRFDLFI